MIKIGDKILQNQIRKQEEEEEEERNKQQEEYCYDYTHHHHLITKKETTRWAAAQLNDTNFFAELMKKETGMMGTTHSDRRRNFFPF